MTLNSRAKANQNGGLHRRCRDTALAFARTTTLPGLVQIAGAASALERAVWLLVLATGLIVTGNQTYYLIRDYLRYGVVERTSRQMEVYPPFPSITVCANNLIDVDKNNFTQTIWREVLNRTKIPDNKNIVYRQKKLERGLTEYLATLPTADRIKAGFEFHDFVIECTLASKICNTTTMTVYHSLVYGNCYTLNSLLKEDNPLIQSGYDGLVITTNPPRNILGGAPEFGPVLVVHEPKTAPPLVPQYIIRLYPAKWLTIKMKRTQIHRMESPYASHCVDSSREIKKKKSFFYSVNTPYEYTWEACTQTCLQRGSFDQCRCYLRGSPLPPNSTNNRLCSTDVCGKLAYMDTAVCDCQQRCSESMYETVLEVNERKMVFSQFKEWLSVYVLRHVNDTQKPDLNTVCGFEAFMASSYVELIKEEPEVPINNVIGSVGGNLGLWIGLSIMSLAELLCLAIKILIVITKYIIKWKTASKKKINARGPKYTTRYYVFNYSCDGIGCDVKVN